MYEAFFGLTKNPFGLTPDAAVLFMTRQHREALAGLTYAIVNRKGLVVLTGAVGTGKSTLLARVLEHLPVTVRAGVILTPTLTPSEFFELALLDLGFQNIPQSKARRLVLLQEYLVAGHKEGKVTVLVVDEAQMLSPEVLEELRLLGNYETSDAKLLQIVLVGQNELCGVLNRPEMRQLKQRVAVRLSIEPISRVEIEQYVRFRWAAAGGAGMPFSAGALESIAQASGGVPRLINSLCGSALLLAFAESSLTIEPGHVMEAASDLDLNTHAVPLPGQLEPRAMEEPMIEPVAARPLVIRTLERYQPRAPKDSWLTRCAGRLGFAH